ncbi:MAG TPA: class I SAM-dependent methyltransferase [Candidatus Woesebacteria bacterium]|nr:class I SAM-dependent methyltransferase [Candidatus Woesebacteria bacterium]
MPYSNSIIKRQSIITKNYLDNEIDSAFRRRAKIILNNLDIKGKMSVLEIGCGRGFYLKILRDLYPTAVITGIDINPLYIHQVKHNIKNVNVFQADAKTLPLADNSFDWIIATEILEHIDNDQKALKEMYRVLKPKGKAIITVPNANYPIYWDPLNWSLERLFKKHIKATNWYLGGIWADHQRLYTDQQLVEKITGAGFKIIKKWSTTHYCLPAASFWFYGLGKHLVEKGMANNLNRFNFTRKPNYLSKTILKLVNIFDKMNRDNQNYSSSVNLICQIEK